MEETASGPEPSSPTPLQNLSIADHAAPPSSATSKAPPPQPQQQQSQPPRNLTPSQLAAYNASPPTAPASRSAPLTQQAKRSSPFQFGTRRLEAADDVFAWNAWDHVDPAQDAAFAEHARAQYALQREHAASAWDRRRFNAEPEKWWDRFYRNNAENFFKDRKWLRQEFLVLGVATGVTHDELEEFGREKQREAAEREEKEKEAEGGRAEGGQADDSGVTEANEQPSASDAPPANDQPTTNGSTTSPTSSPATAQDLPSAPDPSASQDRDPALTALLAAKHAALTALRAAGPWNTLLEIGAGAGNTAFPLLAANRNPRLRIHAADFSRAAVDVMRASKHYDPAHMNACVWDVAAVAEAAVADGAGGDGGKKEAPCLPDGVTPGSVDVALLVFAFSALAPAQWARAVRNVWAALRPGGEVCFRDYGRGDLAQVRFRKGRLLGANFYARGDGTRVYFFEQDELRAVWGGRVSEAAREALKGGVGEEEGEGEKGEGEDGKGVVEERAEGDEDPAFEIISLATDNRLLVNRASKLKMYRCWQQGRFRKPLSAKS